MKIQQLSDFVVQMRDAGLCIVTPRAEYDSVEIWDTEDCCLIATLLADGKLAVKSWDFSTCEKLRVLGYRVGKCAADETRILINHQSIPHDIDPMPELDFEQIKNDAWGNPRYRLHFLDLAPGYGVAAELAKNYGGRKQMGRRNAGYFVWQSYDLPGLRASLQKAVLHQNGAELCGCAVSFRTVLEHKKQGCWCAGC